MKTIIIVGAGAAGMMSAAYAIKNNAHVILVEQNKILGKKLRITGKGRCNVTNYCTPQEFLQNIPTNPKFLFSAINNFTSFNTIEFFEKNGVKLKIERGNRVFPESDKSIDIINAFKKILNNKNCEILNEKVKKLIVQNNNCTGVELASGKKLSADSVILATGGVSYPKTGSTGDGFKLAKSIGHTITPLKPSLVPIVSNNTVCKKLQGLSLKNVAIKVVDKNKQSIVYKDFGEMIFTHFGVSGPIILSASSHLKNISKNQYSLIVDLKPALDDSTLDKRLVKDFSKNINKDYINSLYELLPNKIIPIIAKLSKIPLHTKCNQITKEMRLNLVHSLKNFEVSIDSFRPIEEAIVTSGGISVKEINPKTMESKIIKSLYFAGEIIDVDAYTGGFNLQIAFSTGFLAGTSASAKSAPTKKNF